MPKNGWNNRSFFHLKTRLKLWIGCLKSTAKKLLKRLDFPFDKEIDTMARLAKIPGKKIDETMVKFSF